MLCAAVPDTNAPSPEVMSLDTPPDISDPRKLPDELAREYENCNNYQIWLAKFTIFAARYKAFRGDGDCFY